MEETPKCPYCGEGMNYRFDSILTTENKTMYRGYFYCPSCNSRAPVVSELSELETTEQVEDEAYLMATEHFEPKNRVLTLEEVKAHCEDGADAAPLWYETKKQNSMNRWIIVDVPEFACDITRTVKYLLSEESFIENYRKKHRFWLRKPTKEEMEGTPWA